MLTLAILAAKIDQTNEAIQDWNDSPDPNLKIVFRGQEVAAVSEQIYKELTELFEMTLTSDVEDVAKPIVLAIDDLDAEYLGWLESVETDPEMCNPSGTRELWAKWDAVVEALNVAKTPLPLPEPVKALQVSRVGLQQIAMIYGWKDSAGNWETWKVQEEIDTPGKHYDAKTWVHPTLKRRLASVADAWRTRSRASGNEDAKASKREAPESLEELIRQGVPSAQICKMKSCTPDEVKAEAARIGVPLDGQLVARVKHVDPRMEAIELEAEIKAEAQSAMNAEPKPITDRLRELAARGDSPERIAEILRSENPSMKPANIDKLIKGALATSSV